jgi:hypothetical protein
MDGQAETISPTQSGKRTRQRSTIGFPYADLDSSIKLADAIHQNVGHGDCEDDQLAAWTGQSGKSSTFRVQVYAARMFGIIEGDATHHRLTDLGRQMVDPNQERAARIAAFLSVPLFQAVFEKYKGGTLPPTAALEREIVALGVSDKQKDRARQTFERSAEQSGFFEHGRTRLVQPGISAASAKVQPTSTHPTPAPSQTATYGGGNGGGGGATGDSLLDALIAKLPSTGSTWDVDARIAWLKLITMGFQLAYGTVTDIKISIESNSPTA